MLCSRVADSMCSQHISIRHRLTDPRREVDIRAAVNEQQSDIFTAGTCGHV